MQCDPLRPLSKYASIENQDSRIDDISRNIERLSSNIKGLERATISQIEKIELAEKR